MDAADKTRLEKLLGMLGSSFDGERANAARMIATMAEKERRTIVELIYGTQRPQEEKPKTAPGTVLQWLREIAANPAKYEFIVTDWEFQFATDVGKRYSRDYELSEKQFAVADRIAQKAKRATT